jgi:hypothetical protein
MSDEVDHRQRQRHDLPGWPAPRACRHRRGSSPPRISAVGTCTPGDRASWTISLVTKKSTRCASCRDVVREPQHAQTSSRSLRDRAGGSSLRSGRTLRRPPQDPRTPYDVREVIARLVDGSAACMSSKPLYGTTLVTGFARIHGYSGRDPRQQRHPVQREAVKARTSSSSATQRKIPLLFLQNITGFMIGSQYEHGGIAKDGAKMVNAVARPTSPSSRS